MSDLITLSDVKTYSGISSTNSDTEITNLIPKVSLLVKNYCGRSLLDYYDSLTPKVQIFNGGIQLLMLTEVPLKEVISVEFSNDYGKTYSLLEEYTDYAVDLEVEAVEVIGSNWFPKVLNGYKITYTGGYISTPEDLKLAVSDLITYYMRSDMAIKSTRAPGANSTQIEYVLNATLPAHIRRVLDTYRLIL